jgi:hypothetical protein
MAATNPFLLIVKKITRFALMAAVLLAIYAGVIEWLFANKKSRQVYTTEYWSHRGFNKLALPENSIAAFEHVIRNGVTGIETDVYWQEQQQCFIVTHDVPVNKKDSVLKLEELLARFKDSVSYWIDFKNLTNANQEQAEEALLQMAQQYNLRQRLFVESGNGWALRKFKKGAVQTLYWVQYNRSFPAKWLKLLYIKTLIACSNFNGFTTGYSMYDDDFRERFSGLPLYLFDAPATIIKKETQTPSSIKVFLVDADYFLNPSIP